MKKEPLNAERISDRIFGFIIAGLAILILWSTFNPDWFSLSDQEEARTVLVPRVLLILTISLSALLLLRSFLARAKTAGFSETVDWSDHAGWMRFSMSAIITIVVAATMPFIGFYCTMVVGIAALGIVMGLRNSPMLIGVAVISPAVAWYIIVQVAELSLPRGQWLSLLGMD